MNRGWPFSAAIVAVAIAMPHGAASDTNDLTGQVRDLLATFHETYGFPGATVAYALPDGTLGSTAIEWTGGGFVSTSRDLAVWGQALFTGNAMDAPYLDRLLDAVPVHPDAPGIFYGTGVGIYADTPFGPVYGHGGWVPGYVTSLRHYAHHDITIAFQINTDVGIVDDSTDLVPALEAALAELLVGAIANE